MSARRLIAGLVLTSDSAQLRSGDATKKSQLFVNDYTLIRNRLQIITAAVVLLGDRKT